MWKQCSWLLAACAASVVPSAHAEEIVYPQRVVRTVHVSAPPAKVWAAIGNFSDMSWYPAAVASTEMISGEGNAKGAKRRITLKSGGTLEETLKLYPEGKTTYTYTLEAGVLPVSEYSSTIRVRAYEKGSEVTWIGRFKRQDVADTVGGDAKAVAAVQAVYDGGLAAIVAKFGKMQPRAPSPARRLH